MVPRVFDRYGVERTWAWLIQTYGPVEYDQVEGTGWALAEVREDADLEAKGAKAMPRKPDSAAVLMAKFKEADGSPALGIQVARWWPDPSLPGLPPALDTYRPNGVWGVTNENGDVGFGMGGGDAYFPPSVGASEIWGPDNSARMCGLGWLGLTNHFHLNLVFQWVEDEPEPPPDDQWKDQVRLLAEQILAIVS